LSLSLQRIHQVSIARQIKLTIRAHLAVGPHTRSFHGNPNGPVNHLEALQTGALKLFSTMTQSLQFGTVRLRKCEATWCCCHLS